MQPHQRKRLIISLVVLLPLALLVELYRVASWRPQRMAQDGGVGYATSNAFRVLDVSDDSSCPQREDGSCLRIVDAQGQVRQAAFTMPWEKSELSFISDTQIVVWHCPRDENGAELHGLIFDCSTMRPLRRLETLNAPPTAAAPADEMSFYEGRGFMGQRDILFVTPDEAYAWSLESGHFLRHWKFFRPPHDISRGTTIYVASTDTFVQVGQGYVKIWDAKSGRLLSTAPQKLTGFYTDCGEGEPCSTAKLSADGRLVIYDTYLAAGTSGPINVARCDTGQTLWQIGDASLIKTTCFSPDAREVFVWQPRTPHNPASITVYDTPTGRVLRHLPTIGSVVSLWLSPDGTKLYSVDDHDALWQQRAR